jgi:hypothetical protein
VPTSGSSTETWLPPSRPAVERADEVILLDPPILIRFWRLLRRRERPDQPRELRTASLRRSAVMVAVTALWPIAWRRQLTRIVRSHAPSKLIRIRSRRSVDALLAVHAAAKVAS